MTAHGLPGTRSQRLRIYAFRIFGAFVLLFGIVGMFASSVGVYFTISESSTSGWVPPLLVGTIGIAALAMSLLGLRALRITSIAELEEQSKSKWFEL